MKNHIITISGNIASGKSEVAKILAEELSYEIYKASDEFRRLSREANMTLVDFNEHIELNPDIDIYVDECTKKYVKGKENLIVDARLGFLFVEDAFDVYLKAEIDMAAKRLYSVSRLRGKEEDYSSVEEAKEGIIHREHSEIIRYKQRYNVDITDMSNYTCVVDTTNITSKEAAEKIIQEYNNWLTKKD